MKNIILLFFFTSVSFAQVEIIENFTIYPAGITNNKTIFVRTTPEYGKEIWVSNGTLGNAQLLKDIVPGPTGSEPQVVIVINDIVYFKAIDGQIWRTDGTTNGTYAMESNPQIIDPYEFIGIGKFIFFRDQGKLWKMQSTPNSESLVTTPFTLNFSEISSLVQLDGDEILFNGKLIGSNGKWGIYRSNGVNIDLVKDINSGTHPNAVNSNLEYAQMRSPKNIDGTIYFDGYSSQFQGELWKSDGSFSGTVMIKDIFENNSNPFRQSSIHKIFNKIGNNIYFSANDGVNGIELWKTNELTGNTEMIKDINIGNNNNFGPDNLLVANNKIYFTQNTSENPGNTQIWKTDGTEIGTTPVTSLPTGYLSLTELFYKNNFIYFSLYTSTLGMELWKLNTIDDTYSLVTDIAPGTTSSGPGGFFELNGSIYFTASSDGTSGGTKTYRIIDQNLTNNEATFKPKIKIYPNPVSDVVNIDIENNSNFEVSIYDSNGREISKYKNQKTFDISTLQSGTYMVKIIDFDSNTSTTSKVIKL